MVLREYCEERSRITVSLGPGSALAEKAKNGVKQEKYRRAKQAERDFICSPKPIFSPFPHSEEPCRRLVYSQTEITVNTRNISGMLLCCEKKKTTTTTIRHEKTKRQARTLITVCGFVASSRVLIFAVIGHNTITIPEVFQVFTIFPVPLKK